MPEQTMANSHIGKPGRFELSWSHRPALRQNATDLQNSVITCQNYAPENWLSPSCPEPSPCIFLSLIRNWQAGSRCVHHTNLRSTVHLMSRYPKPGLTTQC